jgi:hypothetical protein
VPDLTEAELEEFPDQIEQQYGGGPQAIAHKMEARLTVDLIRSLRKMDRSAGRYSKAMIGLTVVLAVLTAVLVWLTLELTRAKPA